MFSSLIPGLNSVEYPEDELIGRVPETLRSLLYRSHHLVNFCEQKPSNSGVSPLFRTLILWPTSGFVLILVLASLVCSLYSMKRKKGTNESYADAPMITEAAGKWMGSDAEAMIWSHLNDVLFHENKSEIFSESDAKYAEELQVEEALFASLLTSQTTNSASSSTLRARPILDSLLKNSGNEVAEPSQSFCEICFETKESWQMFRNSTCSHSFCYECTSKHIIAKIQDDIETVRCPGLNCKAMLDINACRFMVPKDILIKWDESLCKSMIIESEKLFCPFSDCSALLVNDNGDLINKIKCPLCRRSFCATCLVPWHSEFTCKEFGKLNAKKIKKEDDMAEALAKKKNWRKCPSCKYFVEKTEGCLHITCRCKYEFCYRCGSKWSSSHGSCRLQS